MDLTPRPLVAGYHSKQTCTKSYKTWPYVLDQGHKQGGTDVPRNYSHHHPLRGHCWGHEPLLWRASADATRPLVSQLLFIHSSPAPVKASITSASAAGSKSMSATPALPCFCWGSCCSPTRQRSRHLQAVACGRHPRPRDACCD